MGKIPITRPPVRTFHCFAYSKGRDAAWANVAKMLSIPMTFNRVGSMFCGYFADGPIWNLADAMRSDRALFARFFHGMMDEGVYLAPSQFEAGFLSTAHGPEEIEHTLRSAEKVLKAIRS